MPVHQPDVATCKLCEEKDDPDQADPFCLEGQHAQRDSL